MALGATGSWREPSLPPYRAAREPARPTAGWCIRVQARSIITRTLGPALPKVYDTRVYVAFWTQAHSSRLWTNFVFAPRKFCGALLESGLRFSAVDVRAARSPECRPPQLSLAPWRIHVRIELRSQTDSCFLLCGMRNSGDARQSSSRIRLLLSGSPGTTIGPNLVPASTP